MDNKLFKVILDNSPESIVLIGKNHDVLAFNKTIQNIHFQLHNKGLEVGAKYYPDFVVDANKDIYLEAFESASKGKEYHVRRLSEKNNASFWFDFKVIPVYDNDEYIGMTLSAKDVTAEVLAEAKHKELSKKLRAILENTDESITLLDTNHKILALNKLSELSISNNTNLTSSVGVDFRDYITDNGNLYYEYYPKALKGETNVVEISYTTVDNEIIWYQTKFNPVYDEVGELIGVSIFAKDITEKKNLELSYKESENRFKTIVENSLIGKFIIQENKLIYTNPEFERIFGYNKKDLINVSSFDNFVHKDDLMMVWDNYSARINSKKAPSNYTFRGVKKDGTIIHLETLVNLITLNNKPAIIGNILNITDKLNEEKRINQAIIEAQEKERLQIGMELHDNVKQILSGNSIYLDIVLLKLDDKEGVTKILNKLKGHNNDAINEIRKLSHQLAPLVENDSSLVDKIEWLIQSMKLHDSMSVVIQFDETNAMLKNEVQLAFYRILQEQFNNILKYSKATKVEINIEIVENKVFLKVKDNGVGFDVNAKRQGIGLENINRRVKMLNGKVEISSVKGKGSEIIISVPL